MGMSVQFTPELGYFRVNNSPAAWFKFTVAQKGVEPDWCNFMMRRIIKVD